MAINKKTLLLDRATIVVLLAIAAILALQMFGDYTAAPDLLWRDFYHDRNSHFSLGANLAVALRTFDLGWFLSELERAKVWPPFHGLVLSAVLLVGGIDHSLAIIPSLIGWATTLVVSAMIARRLVVDRVSGVLAAVVTFTFTAASPAFRLLGSDVMLESLGAALSAVALWCYLWARTRPEQQRPWRLLAVTLTILFFHKGNYWGLAVISITLAALIEKGRPLISQAIGALREVPVLAWLRRCLRDPYLVTVALLLAIIVFLYARGPTSVPIFGHNVRLYPPENLTTVAYAVLFVRLARTWWHHRAAVDQIISIPGRALLYWHIFPIAVSFLLPKRLTTFLWFVGPANSPTQFDLVDGIRTYWSGFVDGFHATTWLALLAITLALTGAIGMRRLRPGAAVIFVFVLVCTIAVIVHPQHQPRFLGSWLFAVWIAAGAGAAVLFDCLLLRRTRIVQALVVGLVILLFAGMNRWQPPSAAAAAAAIRTTSGPPDLDLVRPYLHELDRAKHIAFVTTFGTSALFTWVMRERCRCGVVLEAPWISGYNRADVRRRMAARLKEYEATILVVIDAPGSRYSLPEWAYENMVGIVDAMQSQNRFERLSSYELPAHGATATIWRRRDTGPPEASK